MRGFTLIEILVVIAIIGILASIGFILGKQVIGGGKSALTKDTIRALETFVGAYQGDVGDKIPALYTDGQGAEFPIIDAQINGAAAGVYNSDSNPAEPSLGLFLLAGRASTAIDTGIRTLDPKLVTTGPLVSGAHFASHPSPTDKNNVPLQATTVKDAWGRPIRFVHPKFDGGYGSVTLGDGTVISTRARRTVNARTVGGSIAMLQYIRSIRPAAGQTGTGDEGVCTGSQPYFYSAGADGDPGARTDNVYSNKPSYPVETAKEP